MKAGSAVQWPGRFGYLRDGILHPEQNAPARFIGTPTMNAVVKQLQVELDVRYQHRVERLEKNGRRWNVLGADGHSFGEFDIVSASRLSVSILEGVSPLVRVSPQAHRSMLVVMAAWDTPLAIDFDIRIIRTFGLGHSGTSGTIDRMVKRGSMQAAMANRASGSRADWVAQHILDAFSVDIR